VIWFRHSGHDTQETPFIRHLFTIMQILEMNNADMSFFISNFTGGFASWQIRFLTAQGSGS